MIRWEFWADENYLIQCPDEDGSATNRPMSVNLGSYKELLSQAQQTMRRGSAGWNVEEMIPCVHIPYCYAYSQALVAANHQSVPTLAHLSLQVYLCLKSDIYIINYRICEALHANGFALETCMAWRTRGMLDLWKGTKVVEEFCTFFMITCPFQHQIWVGFLQVCNMQINHDLSTTNGVVTRHSYWVPCVCHHAVVSKWWIILTQ